MEFNSKQAVLDQPVQVEGNGAPGDPRSMGDLIPANRMRRLRDELKELQTLLVCQGLS